MVLAWRVLPLVRACVYGAGELVPPGLVLALALPPAFAAAPVWVYYRDMRFVRQRLLRRSTRWWASW